MRHIFIRQLSAVLFMLAFSACNSQPPDSRMAQSMQQKGFPQPNFYYIIETPPKWTMRDTVIKGLQVRFLIPPPDLRAEGPMANILTAWMEGKDINDFAAANIANLKQNIPGSTVLEAGDIITPICKGRWFTYTKYQNGMIRDMICYMLPENGFAYMITCGTNQGYMSKYRTLFDRIAKSLNG